MQTKKTIISTSAKKRNCPKGSDNFAKTQMVVYKTPTGNGKKFSSQTKHELI